MDSHHLLPPLKRYNRLMMQNSDGGFSEKRRRDSSCLPAKKRRKVSVESQPSLNDYSSYCLPAKKRVWGIRPSDLNLLSESPFDSEEIYMKSGPHSGEPNLESQPHSGKFNLESQPHSGELNLNSEPCSGEDNLDSEPHSSEINLESEPHSGKLIVISEPHFGELNLESGTHSGELNLESKPLSGKHNLDLEPHSGELNLESEPHSGELNLNSEPHFGDLNLESGAHSSELNLESEPHAGELNLNSEPPLDSDDDDGIVCAVCGSTDGDPTDPIVFCDGCNLTVHSTCYGHPLKTSIPEGDWFCARCLSSQAKQPPPISCCLCPAPGGASKPTTDGRWAHLVCSIYVPEVFFSDPENREGINCQRVTRWDGKDCYLCGSNKGCVVDCSEPKCRLSFHVTCGLKDDLTMEFRQGKKNSGRGGGVVAAFCRSHTDLWKKQEHTGRFKIVARSNE